MKSEISRRDDRLTARNGAPDSVDNEYETVPKDWAFKRLGDLLLAVDVRARDIPQDQAAILEILSLTKNAGLIPQTERFGKRIATDDTSKYKVVRSGQIVYNPYVIWEGAVHALRKLPAGLVSPVYPVWETREPDGGYLDYLLRTPTLIGHYNRLCSGAVNRRRSIRPAAFASIEVEVPPLPEQRAIAAVLRTVRRAKEACEQVIAATRALKRSLLQHLFTYGPAPFDEVGQPALRETDYGALQEAWPVSQLSECAHVQTGVAKGRKLTSSDVVELPYLRVANVQDGRLDLTEMKSIALRRTEVARFLLQRGDVVLTEGGDFDKLGRGFIWDGEIEPCVHQNHIFAVRTARAQLLPEFLAYLAQSSYGKAYFLSVAHKTTNLACINATKLKALPVPLPALSEQRAIVSYLSAADAKLAAEEARRAALDRLFHSLLHNLMTGRVRVNHLGEQLDPEATR
jgi:type I restriction enzyme S subunit